jgi:hypothetical protein
MSFALAEVQFASDSALAGISREAFSNCCGIKSITLPSSIEFLGWGCFIDCFELVSFAVLPDSKLLGLDDCVFCGCSALPSLTIPHTVVAIGAECFQGCRSLSTLTFESPARIRDLLDIPPRWTGFQPIPDTVERLQFYPHSQQSCYCALMFGRDSKLGRIEMRGRFDEPVPRLFVQASSRSLKALRSLLEFEGGSGGSIAAVRADDSP